MDAWRDGDTFYVQFDLPGINPDALDLDLEKNTLTVEAERRPTERDAGAEVQFHRDPAERAATVRHQHHVELTARQK
ncbi:Hsp20/alpha crystallin family protein [Streptomyces sp. FH025]|uniref:Hsp20/alpha crystallin family protein n=1 Tax=Streptomyces sp. FH025 TaxID=2815937 RepID=UPI001FAFE3EA